LRRKGGEGERSNNVIILIAPGRAQTLGKQATLLLWICNGIPVNGDKMAENAIKKDRVGIHFKKLKGNVNRLVWAVHKQLRVKLC
jgi:hypothetical protein